jgi:drug/metabolite transporter (DMT)-like permease
MILLGKKQYKHHFLGIILIVLGVTLVSYIHVASTHHTKRHSSLFGVILLISAQFFQGLMFITEEKILTNYHLDPFKVVGTEGMWGLCIFITLLPIA